MTSTRMIRFTREEKTVLLFLVATLFIGAGVIHYKKSHPFFLPAFESSDKQITHSEKVNINKATKEELVKIKGIGSVLAERIISYREKYGPFKNKEGIKSIKGIGEETYDRIKEQITLE